MKNEKKKKETEQAIRLAAHLYCVEPFEHAFGNRCDHRR